MEEFKETEIENRTDNKKVIAGEQPIKKATTERKPALSKSVIEDIQESEINVVDENVVIEIPENSMSNENEVATEHQDDFIKLDKKNLKKLKKLSSKIAEKAKKAKEKQKEKEKKAKKKKKEKAKKKKVKQKLSEKKAKKKAHTKKKKAKNKK